MITIPSGIKDPSYRYKMPKMQLKQESRLNGVKTNIFNVEDVAFHLRVPSKAIMKHMCEQLGANMEKDSILKGKHTYDLLLKHLDHFIGRYVICKNCSYPEIQRALEGKDDLVSKCNSCGTRGTHDSKSKAGKVFLLELKQGKAQVTDINTKDKGKDIQANLENDSDDEDLDKSKKKKKDKKDKKDKKKKKDNGDEEEKLSNGEDVEEDGDISDLDEEISYKSRRTSK